MWRRRTLITKHHHAPWVSVSYTIKRLGIRVRVRDRDMVRVTLTVMVMVMVRVRVRVRARVGVRVRARVRIQGRLGIPRLQKCPTPEHTRTPKPLYTGHDYHEALMALGTTTNHHHAPWVLGHPNPAY